MGHALASRGAARRAVLLPLAVAAAASCGAAPAAPYECSAARVVVSADSRPDARLACQAAEDAIGFLARFGLRSPAAIAVDIVPRLSDGVPPTAVGFYRESDGRVRILDFGEFRKRQTWFNLQIDRTLYRGLVAHEVAHAVAAHNFAVPQPSIQAKEYIAYVTMLATMPPRLRQKVLAQFPGQPFEGEWQMSTTIYLADPMQFGVRAYRHFLAHSDARTFLQDVLAGRALAGSPP
jgi:hypothetical protein